MSAHLLMDADIFAEWLRRQGHSVIQTERSYWVDLGPRVYQAFPYHWQIEPSEAELAELFKKHKVVGLRYSAPISAQSGPVSYHVVFRGNTYRLEDLSKKARYDVRKGLEHAAYKQISFQELATNGWNIRRDTLIRQGRETGETQKWWERLCYSAENMPGFEAWGAIHDDQLIACLLTFTCNDYFCILYQQSLADHIQFGINNALAYVVTLDAIQRPNIQEVFYGLHSLDAPESVDKFKFRMGYLAKPVRQRVVFHPWLEPLIGRSAQSVVKKLAKWTGNPKLKKAEGMLRLFRDGKQEE